MNTAAAYNALSFRSLLRLRVSGISRATLILWLLWMGMVGSASAATTGTWTTAANSGNATAAGVTVNWSGAVGNPYATGTLNATDFWNNPYGTSVAGGPSLAMTIANIQSTTRTINVTFSKAVDNPVLHIDRLGGGLGNINNSSLWTLSGSTSTGGSVTLTRLSGNTVFVVAGVSFQRVTGTADGGNTECTNDPLNGTACGSIRFNGTGITGLSFTVTGVGPLQASSADGMEVAWSIAGSTVIVAKQTVNGTGTFAFSGSNGVGTPSLNTGTANPALSSAFPVTNHANNITVTETVTAGFSLQSAVCRDQSNALVTSALSGSVLTVLAANYSANQTITCTFTNTRNTADLAITKTNTPTAGPNDQASDTLTRGTATTYTLVVTNNGPGAVTGAVVRDPARAGLTCNDPVPCTGSGCPSATVPLSSLQDTGGVVLGTVANAGTVTFTLSCTVQ